MICYTINVLDTKLLLKKLLEFFLDFIYMTVVYFSIVGAFFNKHFIQCADMQYIILFYTKA